MSNLWQNKKMHDRQHIPLFKQNPNIFKIRLCPTSSTSSIIFVISVFFSKLPQSMRTCLNLHGFGFTFLILKSSIFKGSVWVLKEFIFVLISNLNIMY